MRFGVVFFFSGLVFDDVGFSRFCEGFVRKGVALLDLAPGDFEGVLVELATEDLLVTDPAGLGLDAFGRTLVAG